MIGRDTGPHESRLLRGAHRAHHGSSRGIDCRLAADTGLSDAGLPRAGGRHFRPAASAVVRIIQSDTSRRKATGARHLLLCRPSPDRSFLDRRKAQHAL